MCSLLRYLSGRPEFMPNPYLAQILITWEFPRLCRGGSRSLTYTAVVLRETCDGLRRDVMRGAARLKHKQLRSRMQHGNTVRWVHSRSLQSDILARCRCHHGDCSAFRSLELGKCHWPLQAALSGSIIKAPGFAGGYLLGAAKPNHVGPHQEAVPIA